MVGSGHSSAARGRRWLAEAFYRRDDFQKAAAALRGVEVGTNKLIIEQYPTLNVAKLESFKGQTPYEHGDGQTTRLKFLNTASPPVVSVRVNGGVEVTFFIDTGGSELGLDSDFAKELGIPQFGDVQGTFAGGQQAKVGQSRIESLKLGDWTVRNLPVMTQPFRQLSAGLGVKRIDGVIGTSLLPFPGDTRFSARRARPAPQERG
jgi:Aspartyl protease